MWELHEVMKITEQIWLFNNKHRMEPISNNDIINKI